MLEAKAKAAVFDCFPFFNELDLLEIRLRETESVVDRWVLVEAELTHQGSPKPLFYRDNIKRFAKWNDRIIHVVTRPGGVNTSEREWSQRRDVLIGLNNFGAKDDDIAILADADEIPSSASVASYRQEMGRCYLEQRCFYYWLNCEGGLWGGPKITTVGDLRQVYFLNTIRYGPAHRIGNGGWHFSYLGGAEGMRTKLESFLHDDLNKPHLKADLHLRVSQACGFDLFDRPGHNYRFVGDEGLPDCVKDKKFDHLIAKGAKFNHQLTDPMQVRRLCWTFEGRVAALQAAVVEFGCWEGVTAAALAHCCWPDNLHAVDTWQGSESEGLGHPTVTWAKEHSVYQQFVANMKALTRGNVIPHRMKTEEWLKCWKEPIKFAHVDAAHDYASVRAEIAGLQKFLIPGGIICGDDILTANASRADLEGGVERAVRELCPGFEVNGNLWIWQKR